MHVCMHTHTHITRTYACTHTHHVHTRTHTHTHHTSHTRMHAHTHITRTYACTHTLTLHTRTHTHTHAPIHTHTHTYTYHTPTHTQQGDLETFQHLEGHHSWFACTHSRPTYCNVCKEMLHGVAWHGLSCEVCKFKSHRRCVFLVKQACKWTTQANLEREDVRVGQDVSVCVCACVCVCVCAGVCVGEGGCWQDVCVWLQLDLKLVCQKHLQREEGSLTYFNES